jgi:hypothetical protein
MTGLVACFGGKYVLGMKFPQFGFGHRNSGGFRRRLSVHYGSCYESSPSIAYRISHDCSAHWTACQEAVTDAFVSVSAFTPDQRSVSPDLFHFASRFGPTACKIPRRRLCSFLSFLVHPSTDCTSSIATHHGSAGHASHWQRCTDGLVLLHDRERQ